jgi:hypothetical protein
MHAWTFYRYPEARLAGAPFALFDVSVVDHNFTSSDALEPTLSSFISVERGEQQFPAAGFGGQGGGWEAMDEGFEVDERALAATLFDASDFTSASTRLLSSASSIPSAALITPSPLAHPSSSLLLSSSPSSLTRAAARVRDPQWSAHASLFENELSDVAMKDNPTQMARATMASSLAHQPSKSNQRRNHVTSTAVPPATVGGSVNDNTCDVCGKVLKNDFSLRRHKETHLSVRMRPFSCKTCGKTFVQKSHMTKHLRNRSNTCT